jgi:hypothetical protein
MTPLRAAAAEFTRGRQESIWQHRLAASILIRTSALRHLANTQHTNTQHTLPHTIPLVCPPRLAMSQGGVRIQKGGGKGVPIKDATTTGGNAPMMVKGAVASTLVARLSMRPTLLIAHLPVDSGEMVQAHGEVQ